MFLMTRESSLSLRSSKDSRVVASVGNFATTIDIDDRLQWIGIVSTAFIADATPAALTAHTAERGEYGAVVDSFLNGAVNVGSPCSYPSIGLLL